jgi:radical SAM superfamily enzyme YgiQ (UPF0313 family)/ligand-binding sensor protein
MVTRIDKLLGKEIFESIQDKVPKNIGIMVGIKDTSGSLITGKRKYETCAACRELINPCFRKKDYSCDECDLFTPKDSPICSSRKGNESCTESDTESGAEATRTNMVVLYRCLFGLANYAIPIRIGELGSIILYGGQFRIEKPKPTQEFRDLIEDADTSGKRIVIREKEFREAVLDVDQWRQNHGYSPHLLPSERDRLMEEYLKEPEARKTIRVFDLSTGNRHLIDLKLNDLENLLRGRYNLSIFEAWGDFLGTLPEPQIRKNAEKTAAGEMITRNLELAEDVEKIASAKLEEYEVRFREFLYPTSEHDEDYKLAMGIIPLSKALSTIELLKEIATLISRTANVVFYKDTYFMLKHLWDNHPVSTIECFDGAWRRCEMLLQELDTSGKDPLPPSISRHLELVGELTKNLMFFAYKLLFDDFGSVTSMLRHNYELIRAYEPEQVGEHETIKTTEKILDDIITASCLFISDLLEAKYEQLSHTGLWYETVRFLPVRSKVTGYLRGCGESVRKMLEGYYEEGKPTLPVLPENIDSEEIENWKTFVLGTPSDQGLLQTASTEHLESSDIMLKFFSIVFDGYLCKDDTQTELSRIDVNLRWADATIREQIEHISASVLQFDVCQSFLQFIHKVRDSVYADRFQYFRKLANQKDSKEHELFNHRFMNRQDMVCNYFIDHGIDHVTKVLTNVDYMINFAERHSKDETKESVCSSPIWQYYVRCAALFHDVGMFGGERHKSVYGGPDAVRRCHGAFSGKRIIEERIFDILGNELDKLIIAQICAFHQGEAEIRKLHKNLQPLAALLRIADEFDVSEKRLSTVTPGAAMAKLASYTDDLREKLIPKLPAKLRRELVIPTKDSGKKEIQKLMRQTLEFAKSLGYNYSDIRPTKISCFEFVQRLPRYVPGSSYLVDVIRTCSEISGILDTGYHYQKHKCVKDVAIVIVERGETEAYLVPEIHRENLECSPHGAIDCSISKQPKIIAMRVKSKFKREIDAVKEYLEPVGIRFQNPRIKGSHTENLLFVNAPPFSGKLKFVGAPTSLLYAIAPTSRLIEEDPRYMDVNIEIWDPTSFDEKERKELGYILRDLKPKIIGVSNTSTGHLNALEIARIANEQTPKPIIIFGGSHENVRFAETIEKHHEHVNISIGGVEEPLSFQTKENESNRNGREGCATINYRADAENVLCEIVKKILAGNSSRNQLSQLMEEINYKALTGKFALAFWDGEKPVIKNSNSNNNLELDKLPAIPRHLLQDSDRYDYEVFRNPINGELRKTAQVTTTRGCIRRCAFCSSVGRSNRRKIANVIEELKKLKKAGYEAIFFDDSTFADECGTTPLDGHDCPYTSDPCPRLAEVKKVKKEHPIPYVVGKCGYVIKLCHEMIMEKLNFVWGCQTRADVINDDLLENMKRAGCVYIYFGLESLNDSVLRGMCKDISAEQMKKGIRRTREKGLNVGISLVFGLEGESTKTVEETIIEVTKLLQPVPASDSRVTGVSINIATIYPGTKLEERLRRENAEMPDFDHPPKFIGYPYNQFEEAGWNLLPCCVLQGGDSKTESEELAKKILKNCRAAFERTLL